MIRRFLQSLVLLIVTMSGIVSAQSIPMTVDLHQQTRFPKGDGPVSFVWQCSVSATGLLEGHFLVTAFEDEKKYGQFRSHDVALHSGFHEIPMILPPIDVTNPFGEIKLKLTFVSKQKRYDFKNDYTLHVGRRFQRVFTVGVCDPFDIRFSPKIQQFIDDLKFDSISPEEPITLDTNLIVSHLPNLNLGKNQSFSLNANTFSIQIHPPEFPQLPIDCHQYDVLVITSRGFDLLKSRHLKAIHQWVRSGGSVCVMISSSLEQHQLQFLNDLLEEQKATPFLINPEGKIEFAQDQKVILQRTGWGRSVILQTESFERENLSPDDLSNIPFFLWKLRKSQREYYEEEKKWDHVELAKVFLQDMKTQRNAYQNSYAFNEMLSLNYKPMLNGGAVVTSLMPTSIRIVPPWIIMWVLVGYVLIIGPGEYYILGQFRIRRFTWITFPLISIGFALLAFLISDYYMQSSYERKTLTILDLDAQGIPVKENQIELLFTGSYKNIETPIKSGLFTALNHRELGQALNYMMYRQNVNTEFVGAPYYSGSIPTQYSVFQMMPQWTPQLNRIIHNYPAELKTNFDWSKIKISQLKHDSGRQEFRKQIKSAFGDQAHLSIYHGVPTGTVKKYSYFMSEDYTRNHMRYSKVYELVNPVFQQYRRRVGQPQGQHSFLDDLCVRKQNGLFQIVSQTSPSGGKNFEDLSILDPSDANQWLVVIFVPSEKGDMIYRQFLVAEG
ncbi:MAG: hypothetical protein QM501_02105 [Gimesia sp.]